MKERALQSETAMKRRQFLKGTAGVASLVALAGCDNLTQSSWFPSILPKAEKLTERVQQAVTPTNALAKEYGEADISRVFPQMEISLPVQRAMPRWPRTTLPVGTC